MKTTITQFNNDYMSGSNLELPLVETEAWIWNGQRQLPGRLRIWSDRLLFQLLEFPDSHLKLEIFRSDIQEIDSFLVFNISKLGVMIRTQEGKSDRLIFKSTDEVRRVIQILKDKIS